MSTPYALMDMSTNRIRKNGTKPRMTTGGANQTPLSNGTQTLMPRNLKSNDIKLASQVINGIDAINSVLVRYNIR